MKFRALRSTLAILLALSWSPVRAGDEVDPAVVDALTGKLSADGYTVLDGPRRTGDGYYESKVLDPTGNLVEITI